MHMCMRTNIELNDELVDEARKYSHNRSRRALVEEALETYVAVKSEERRRQTYCERLQKVRTATAGIRLRSDTRDIVRRDRESR